jgi:hypothetical protein
MRSSRRPFAALAVACSLAGGLFAASAQAAVDLSAMLQAPAGQVEFLRANGQGVQIYQCKASPDQPGAAAWVLTGPQATLTDVEGKLVAKHFAGPTWQSVADGSTVVGQVVSQATPEPTAIAWLLLSAKSSQGQGLFAHTASIQRSQTEGGVAPANGCDQAHLGQSVQVPYKALYTFYRAAG